jgi:hypothetical protein
METLSAPDAKYSLATSSALTFLPSGSTVSLMPPPTVRGTKTVSEARRSTSSMGWSVAGQLRKLVMLRKVTSSAPCR